MALLTRMLKQVASYFAPSTPDSHGQTTFTAPVEIKARWEDVTEEVLDANGRTVLSRARVYVESDVSVGGALVLSALADLTDEDDPWGNPGAAEIIRFEKLPTLNAKKFLRTAYL